jgi:hypothetical protein
MCITVSYLQLQLCCKRWVVTETLCTIHSLSLSVYCVEHVGVLTKYSAVEKDIVWKLWIIKGLIVPWIVVRDSWVGSLISSGRVEMIFWLKGILTRTSVNAISLSGSVVTDKLIFSYTSLQVKRECYSFTKTLFMVIAVITNCICYAECKGVNLCIH